MFNRFTENARRAMGHARRFAAECKHDYIGVEHIFVGVLRVDTSVACKALKALRVDPSAIEASIQSLVETNAEGKTVVQIPFTPRAKKLVEDTMLQASDLRHNYIGTEHLLLALSLEHGGVAGRVLPQFGIGHAQVKERVIQVCDALAQAREAAPGTKRETSSELLWEVFSRQLGNAMISAKSISKHAEVAAVSPEALLYGIINARRGNGAKLVHAMVDDVGGLLADVGELVEKGLAEEGAEAVKISTRCRIALGQAMIVCAKRGHATVGTDHVVWAIMEGATIGLARVLNGHGSSPAKLVNAIEDSWRES
jgi:ATP-dependent Clp protease ATP-binding subunit ClpA